MTPAASLSTTVVGDISPADASVAQLVHQGLLDPRVAEGLAAFRLATSLVPMPSVSYAPVRYTTTTCVATRDFTTRAGADNTFSNTFSNTTTPA